MFYDDLLETLPIFMCKRGLIAKHHAIELKPIFNLGINWAEWSLYVLATFSLRESIYGAHWIHLLSPSAGVCKIQSVKKFNPDCGDVQMLISWLFIETHIFHFIYYTYSWVQERQVGLPLYLV